MYQPVSFFLPLIDQRAHWPMLFSHAAHNPAFKGRHASFVGNECDSPSGIMQVGSLPSRAGDLPRNSVLGKQTMQPQGHL